MSNSELPIKLLSKIFSGRQAELPDIEKILNQHTAENLHLELKRGDFLVKQGQARLGSPTEPAAKIRKWVSGFANADGGLLLVGVADGTLENGSLPSDAWSIVGLPTGIKGAADTWARSALEPLRAHLIPAPRIQIISDSQNRETLIIAVSRAPNLVPCVEEGRSVYYLRLHDSTAMVPEYLLQDLVLGRRQRPVLDMKFGLSPLKKGSNGAIAMECKLQLENSSLVWAHDLSVGIIGFEVGHNPITLQRPLVEHLDIQPFGDPEHQPIHNRHVVGTLEPFRQTNELTFSCELGNERYGLEGRRWNGAVYALSSNGGLSWWQLQVDFRMHAQNTESWQLAPGELAKIAFGKPETPVLRT